MEKNESPLVSIRCAVYNHGPYLRQCLDGFVMQKTNFAFEAIVHDDASTDNSAEIIREYAEKYPDIIKPIYETENQYSKRDGSLNRILNSAVHPNSKYIALCEGDDYWIDPLKLQKQVDFMEIHPDYAMTFSTIKVCDMSKTKQLYVLNNVEDREYSGLDYFIIRPSQTSTFLLKKEILFTEYYQEVLNLNFGFGDIPLVLTCAHLGKLGGLSDCTSVYRKHAEGWTRKAKNKEEIWNRINSQLKFCFFGKEYEFASKRFYIRHCIYAYLISVKNRSIDNSFIIAAFKMSFFYTLKYMFEILFQQIKKQL